MTEQQSLPHSWKQVKTMADVQACMDQGLILPWTDAKRLRKLWKGPELDQLMQQVAQRFHERLSNRLGQEILLESIVLILVHSDDQETAIRSMVEAMADLPDRSEVCAKFVEIALTGETAEDEHEDVMFSMAVSVVCELGFTLKDRYQKGSPGAEEISMILGHISTYLLSVSNSNNSAIRLSLLNYFGDMEAAGIDRDGFNKVMSRFGHTVLEQLFYLLFNKKSEGLALQYLLQNSPHILGGDRHCQRIIHETWKFYMLKRPDRFGLFIQALSQHLVDLKSNSVSDLAAKQKLFCQHLGVLLAVVSEVNHRELAKELICAMVPFRTNPQCQEVFEALAKSPELRSSIKELMHKILDPKIPTAKVISLASRFISIKRGRKPSFQKGPEVCNVDLVHNLGAQAFDRAS